MAHFKIQLYKSYARGALQQRTLSLSIIWKSESHVKWSIICANKEHWEFPSTSKKLEMDVIVEKGDANFKMFL